MAFFIAALGSVVVLLVVLMVIDIDISQTRRIEKQVARDQRRIRAKTIQGWSVERIAARYPSLSPEHIHQVRRRMARSVQAEQEIQQLKAMWTSDAQPESEG